VDSNVVETTEKEEDPYAATLDGEPGLGATVGKKGQKGAGNVRFCGSKRRSNV